MGKMMNGILVGVLIFLVLVVAFGFYVASDEEVISGAVVGVVPVIEDSLEKVSGVISEIKSKGEELEELRGDVGDVLEVFEFCGGVDWKLGIVM